ncbi:MAG: DUF4118 domain-containing protein [Actinobacteria bacterium]|nr:DUF4118 domain-containing protein [Actinomycetota bacterium]
MLRRSLLPSAQALLASVLAVAVITFSIALLDNYVPPFGLVVLYTLAVLAIAFFCGRTWASVTAVASMLAFNFFFLPPAHSLSLQDSSYWFALLAFVVTAIVVGTLAANARNRAVESEQRSRETALLADVATELLRRPGVERELTNLAEQTAKTLGLSSARLELRSGRAELGELPYPLGEDGGVLYAPTGEEPSLDARRRLLPALGALLAFAQEREQLAGEALAAETLRRSDAAKTAVLRAVSHDFRTPLATIETALGSLTSSELELTDDDRASLLDTIRLEHQRLKRLVEDILDLSRLQAGAADPALELWPASALVEQALDALPRRDRVKVALRDDLPLVRVDAVQLQRALVNVLENALRVSPPDQTVTVDVHATRKELLIRVVDQGPGVPPDELERIFTPFHQLGPAGGAGLGLAIARGFAEANGGRLWAESRAGQGASFAFALPAVEGLGEIAG